MGGSNETKLQWLNLFDQKKKKKELRLDRIENLLLVLAELASLGFERENRSINVGDLRFLHEQIPHLSSLLQSNYEEKIKRFRRTEIFD